MGTDKYTDYGRYTDDNDPPINPLQILERPGGMVLYRLLPEMAPAVCMVARITDIGYVIEDPHQRVVVAAILGDDDALVEYWMRLYYLNAIGIEHPHAAHLWVNFLVSTEKLGWGQIAEGANINISTLRRVQRGYPIAQTTSGKIMAFVKSFLNDKKNTVSLAS